ncbi:MAG: hypothetical protein M3Y66_00345 [Actinomycetota bacterium]|nr:hypothetical protein [Actinomycetota bacterium]
MRTAPFPPHPPYLLPMPDVAAVRLAAELHARGEHVGGVNGALPAAELFARETARLVGGAVSVAQHTRLFELDILVSPVEVPGRLRIAIEDDLELATAWFTAFMDDADEQAGRPGDPARMRQ